MPHKGVDDYIFNRHEEWIKHLLEEIEQGGAFIAVGMAHVTRPFATDVRKTLLEAFAEHGVHIEPIAFVRGIARPINRLSTSAFWRINRTELPYGTLARGLRRMISRLLPSRHCSK